MSSQSGNMSGQLWQWSDIVPGQYWKLIIYTDWHAGFLANFDDFGRLLLCMHHICHLWTSLCSFSNVNLKFILQFLYICWIQRNVDRSAEWLAGSGRIMDYGIWKRHALKNCRDSLRHWTSLKWLFKYWIPGMIVVLVSFIRSSSNVGNIGAKVFDVFHATTESDRCRQFLSSSIRLWSYHMQGYIEIHLPQAHR